MICDNLTVSNGRLLFAGQDTVELAKQYGVQMPADQLYIKGEAFALRAGGRSPRVAKQFIELCKAGVFS